MAPDFTVGCIEFDGGVVARVTCGLAAPRDKSITVVGDKGTLMVGNVRDDRAPVMWRSVVPGRLERSYAAPLASFAHRWFQARLHGRGCRGTLCHTVARDRACHDGVGRARQASRLSAAVRRRWPMPSRQGRRPVLSAEFGVHLVEIVERLQYPERFADDRVTSTLRADRADAVRRSDAGLDPDPVLQRPAMDSPGDRKRAGANLARHRSHRRRRRFDGRQPRASSRNSTAACSGSAGANRGSNPTRNRLMPARPGAWVQYLDADDYLLPDKIAAPGASG